MAIHLEDVVWVALVSMAASYQMGQFAQRVGLARRKHKIQPPATEGPPEFMRALRAQQNTVEFAPIFLPALWICALFFHQVPAALAGLAYIFYRYRYFNSYVMDAQARVAPFHSLARVLRVLLAMSTVGFLNTLLRMYGGVDAKERLLQAYYGTK